MYSLRRLLLAGTAALILLAGGCSGSNDDTQKAKGPNVLIIAVDTLRADRLGCYGSDLGATPNIDQFADTGVRFARTYAHAPWTLPSFASLFTGVAPPVHGAGGQLGQFRRLRDSAITVAETFRDAGYETAAIVNVDFLTATFGMTQGFGHVDFDVHANNMEARNATDTTDAALMWLKKAHAKPTFLFVHYFDPHLVYSPPAEFRARFAAPQDREDASWLFGTRPQIIAYRNGEVSFDEPTIRRAEHLYNGEVAYTDQQIGRLLAGVRDAGLDENTIVVFVADHGEEFWDHGGFEHGHSLYDELLHVPLIIRAPKMKSPRVVETPVGLVDVAPTLCTLAGVTVPAQFAGQDLASVITDGDAALNHALVLEGNFWGPPFHGLLHDDYKLITGENGVGLFNLADDPRELNDLSKGDPHRLRRMIDDLQILNRAMRAQALGSANVELSPDEIERLRTFGYIK